jgi:4-hydroxy-tetrahydrodipicolinate reductase
MIQVAVVGARGRIGRLIVEAVKQDQETHLCAELSRATNHSLLHATAPIDIVIDFTAPVATLAHLKICQDQGYGMVIGTTGFTKAEQTEISKAAKDIPIVFSPNMSIGVNVSFKLLEVAASILQGKADVAILDLHHKHKQDAPSGTALKMAEIIKNASGAKITALEMSSARVGEVVGDHSILFVLNGERLEIIHRATDRALFAKGAIHATKWLVDQKPGLYDMQDVLGLGSL